MTDRAAHLAAFERLADLLRTSAAANARALQVHRGSPAGDAIDRQLEHTLDRLALLYGRGTYENLDTTEIFEAAIQLELSLAHDVEPLAAGAAAAHRERATALVAAARRGVRLHLNSPVAVPEALRAVYVAPLSPDLERSLHELHEPYLLWRGGAVVIVRESALAAMREPGTEVAVLFLDPDELLDLDGRGDRPALEAELERRLAAARAAPDGVGDSRERHLVRLLLRYG